MQVSRYSGAILGRLVITFVVLGGLAGMSYLACAPRVETKQWSEEIPIVGGKTMIVNHVHKKYEYVGHPHVFGYGGEQISHLITFEFDGRKHQFESKFVPIALHALNNNTFYLVVFDRETDFSKIRFRYYQLFADKPSMEISATSFPKQLAIQNMWLKRNNGFSVLPDGTKKVHDEYQLVHDMDPAEFWFRWSLTCYMWVQLENGIEYFDAKGRDCGEEFVRNYKLKYIAQISPATRPSLP